MSKELVTGFKLILAKIPMNGLTPSEIHLVNITARQIFTALTKKDIASDAVLITQLKERVTELEDEKLELELKLMELEDKSLEVKKPGRKAKAET